MFRVVIAAHLNARSLSRCNVGNPTEANELVAYFDQRVVLEICVMRNSKGDSGLAREERLQIMLSPEELKAVDNFRFQHRMPTRAAAVRELLRHGIEEVAISPVAENAGITSGDYSVLKAPKRNGLRRN